MAGTPSEAPSSNEAPSGSATACRAGSTVHSAAVPQQLPTAASHSQTRSPIRAGSTPAPTASITPAPSWCGTWKLVDGPRDRPGPGLVIGGVDARGVHPDQDLARTRLGPVHLLDFEDLGRLTHVPVQRCSHGCSVAPLKTLSTALRGPCTARPAKLSALAGTARTTARLSSSFPVANMSMV